MVQGDRNGDTASGIHDKVMRSEQFNRGGKVVDALVGSRHIRRGDAVPICEVLAQCSRLGLAHATFSQDMTDKIAGLEDVAVDDREVEDTGSARRSATNEPMAPAPTTATDALASSRASTPARICRAEHAVLAVDSAVQPVTPVVS